MNHSRNCPAGVDDRFGPHVIGCRDDFDFTLLFEQSVLSLAPTALLILVSVPRIAHLRCRDTKVVPTPLQYCKNLAILCSACLRLALLVLWTTLSRDKTRVSIAAASSSFASTFLIAILSNLEHSRSPRPSFIINTFLFFTTLLDLAQVRTLWIMSNSDAIASTFTACVAFNLVIMALESIEKRAFLKDPYNTLPPEALSGIFNRSIFWWLNGIFLKGYRCILSLGDLFRTDEELSSKELQVRMRISWKQYHEHGKHALIRATLSALKRPIAKTIFPRLCVSALTLSQPLLIRRAVSLMSEPRTPANRNAGYGLIGATAIIYLGLAIGNAKYKHRSYRVLTMVRGGLICLISDITLGLESDSSVDSAAVTLMSTDVDRIIAGLEYSDWVWAAPIEIGVALFLLWREIGLSCLMPLGISIGSAIAVYSIGNAAAATQKSWVDAVQRRVGVTASMLGSLKAVKMMGLADMFSQRVQNLKTIELTKSNKFRYITTVRNVISTFSFIAAPALTFAVFTTVNIRSSASPTFNPATAFTSLSIIALISQSVQWWVNALFLFQASLGCYDRIEKYLRSDSRKDPRNHTKTIEDEREHVPGSLDNSKPSHNIHASSHQELQADFIRITSGYGHYDNKDLPIIKDLNLHIKKSTITMVVGPVGCGKSTLLRLILGELPLTSGEVHVATPEIGYCAQDPWLPNHTIKNIISGFGDLDQKDWYRTVIRACALDADIDQFSAGDETLVGSKGVSLSGGQKQRLALARALYARPQILLLDDVLSGLDRTTEQAVFQHVLGPEGLCRKYGITAVLVTHAVRYLRHADQVVVLNGDGRISEQGPPAQVMTPEDLDDYPKPEQNGQNASAFGSDTVPNKPAPTVTQGSDTGIGRAVGDIKIYAYYASTIGWLIPLFFGVEFATTFFIRFPDVWLRWWSASEVSQPGQRTGFYLGMYCGFAILALCCMAVGIMIIFTRIMPRSSTRLHKRLLETVIAAPYAFVASTDTGSLLNRFSQDMSLIDMQLPTALLQTASGLLGSIAQAVLITMSSRFVATIIPGALAVLYVLQRFYLRTSRQMRLLDLECKSPLYTHFLETLSGLHTIRAFNWQHTWNERTLELLDQSQQPVYMLYCIQRWLELALDGMVAVCAIIVIALATQLNQTSSSAGGTLGVALVNLLQLSGMLSYLIRAWTDMETSIGAVHRIRDFEMETPCESDDAVNEVQEELQTSWPSQGVIEFRKMSATYDISKTSASATEEKSTPNLVLKDITLSILPKAHIGICGRTGSGKSSLLLTLLQMIEITSGSIYIDGIDISTIPRSTLRDRILSVPQSPELFPGTIRENLDPFTLLTDDSIIETLTLVGLWQVIEARGGLTADAANTPLSSGERQLFALAYALLRRRTSNSEGGILILDEFSASVDVETEKRIMSVVSGQFRGWTVLSVAHRLETIKGCDMVVVMDGGRIVESGEPGTLRTIDFDDVER